MVCRKNPDLPHTALRARLSLIPRFPAIHLTRQSPFYRTPRHIGSRDGIDLCPSSDPNPSRQHSRAYQLARWFAGRIPACHTQPSEPGWSPVPRFPAIHLSRQSPFYGPPGHIDSRDGIDLCPSSAANPSRQHSRAYPLARCFAGRPPNDIDLPHTAVRARLVPNPSRSCNSSDKAIAILGASRPYRLARCFAGRSPNDIELPHTAVRARSHTFLQFICHGNRHSTGLQGISARAMASICVHRAPRTPPDSTPGHISSRDDLLG